MLFFFIGSLLLLVNSLKDMFPELSPSYFVTVDQNNSNNRKGICYHHISIIGITQYNVIFGI